MYSCLSSGAGALTTPVLLVAFNRPETTRRVFERIREVRPRKLYIAADGPRSGRDSDSENCRAVRDIASRTDWPCEVRTRFPAQNFGCRMGVSSAVSWFFESEPEGIVLEDDILPDVSFFRFCEEMLARYRDDQRVMHISGVNVCDGWRAAEQSYHFAYFGSIWGWASWRRAWRHYDVDIRWWSDRDAQNALINRYFPAAIRTHRRRLYDDLHAGKIDTWDYQWTLARLRQDGLSVIPSVNLVTNIGFDANATHAESAPKWFSNVSCRLTEFAKAPIGVSPDAEYDRVHLELTQRNLAYADWCAKEALIIRLQQSRDIRGILALATAALNTGDRSQCVHLLELATAVAPNDARLVVMLGNMLLAEGRLTDAIMRFEAGVRAHPNDAGLWYQLALARQKEGDAAASDAALQRALALDRKHQRASMRLQRELK